MVHFGYNKADYETLTPTEIAFIKKAHETAWVETSTMQRDSFLNAYANANRKKGKPFRHLWSKRQTIDPETARNDMRTIKEIEKHETGWIEKIKRATGKRL